MESFQDNERQWKRKSDEKTKAQNLESFKQNQQLRQKKSDKMAKEVNMDNFQQKQRTKRIKYKEKVKTKLTLATDSLIAIMMSL